MKKIRRRIRFMGRVQGVGFRYRAKYAASLHAITGFVRNEWDGSVTVEAQGSAVSLGRFLALIKDDYYIRVDDMEITDLEEVQGEKHFRVRY